MGKWTKRFVKKAEVFVVHMEKLVQPLDLINEEQGNEIHTLPATIEK